jgi:hypothetical protein
MLTLMRSPFSRIVYDAIPNPEGDINSCEGGQPQDTLTRQSGVGYGKRDGHSEIPFPDDNHPVELWMCEGCARHGVPRETYEQSVASETLKDDEHGLGNAQGRASSVV